MLRSHCVWLVPVVLTSIGFGLDAAPATAQTNYTFSANYDISSTSRVIASDVSEAFLSGTSTDALYELNEISGLTYFQTDPATGFFSFNTDPTTFGLQGIPTGSIVLGSGSNKLFGDDSGNGLIDFANLTATASGTFTITGGEGIFKGATGTLAFSEFETLSLDPTVPVKSQALLSGSFQVASVPEPRTDTAMIVMGVIGSGVLLRRRHLCSTSG